MKSNCLLAVLLLLLAGAAVQLSAQPTEAERREFAAVKAKADKGDVEAQLILASFYARGLGVAQDPKKAAKVLRQAAEQGSAPAQCRLGLSYLNGEGVKVDQVEGARWLRRAADQGLAEAQFDLGLCYAGGEGVSRDVVEAAAWYRKAADQGLPDAQGELGNCYLEGNGVPKDVPEGVKWTRLAAEQGFAPAQNRLGLCYSRGTGVPKDCLEAYKWLNLAAAKGDAAADDVRMNLAAAERFLTPEQIAEGQRLAREFRPRKAGAPRKMPAKPDTGSAGTPTPPSPADSAPAGFVNVSAPDDACEILVDGAFVGHTPARVKLPEGAHVVEVKKPGFKNYHRLIQITGGSELTLRAVLEK